MPTTPNPTSGFFLMVPRADAIELNMSVDEALKYVISMGVVAPPQRQPVRRQADPVSRRFYARRRRARQSPPVSDLADPALAPTVPRAHLRRCYLTTAARDRGP